MFTHPFMNILSKFICLFLLVLIIEPKILDTVVKHQYDQAIAPAPLHGCFKYILMIFPFPYFNKGPATRGVLGVSTVCSQCRRGRGLDQRENDSGGQ